MSSNSLADSWEPPAAVHMQISCRYSEPVTTLHCSLTGLFFRKSLQVSQEEPFRILSLSLSLSPSLRFNCHFPGEPGLAGVYSSKGWWGGGDNWTNGAISRAKLQSNHHQQTNIQFFTGQMPFLSPNQQCQSTEGKNIAFHGLAYPKRTWVFQLRLWPLIAPGCLGGELPCLSSAGAKLFTGHVFLSPSQWCHSTISQ